MMRPLTNDERLIARSLVMGQKLNGRELSSVEIIALNSALERVGISNRAPRDIARDLIAEYRSTQHR